MSTIRMKAATGQMFDIDEDGNVSPVRDAAPAAPKAPPPGRAPQPKSFTASDDELGIGDPAVKDSATTGGEAFRRGAQQGASLGFGDEISAAADTAIAHIPGLRTVAGAIDRHTGGSGPGLPIDDPTISYAARRDSYRARDKKAEHEHGGAYLGGEVVGGLAAPIPGGTSVKEAKTLAQGLKAGAVTGAKIGGAAGLGDSTADDFTGQLLDTAKGAGAGLLAGAGAHVASEVVGRVVGGASKRVLDRSAVDVTTGEQNAGKRITAKFTDRAGEDNERLGELYERHPEIKKAIALHASADPAKAAKAVGAKVSEVGDKLDEIEAKMDAAGRTVKPAEIIAEFDRMMGDRLKSGDLDAIKALRKARDGFAEEFGSYGPLSAGQLRGLKRTAARQAFVGDPTAPASIKAQVEGDVWRVFSGAQERAAEATSRQTGVKVDELKALNTDMSVLLPMQRTLDERAASAKANRKSIGEHIMTGAHSVGGLAAGAVMGHPVIGAVAGLAAPAVGRAGQAVVRRADYALATNPYVANVLEGLRRGLALPAAVEAAQAAGRAAGD